MPVSHAPPYRTLYVSTASVDACGPDIAAIVGIAVAHNASHGLTGVLGFSGLHFAQVLEGPLDAIERLMMRIRRDPRHRLVAERAPAPALDGRWFPGWAMGYRFDAALDEAASATATDPAAWARLAALLRADPHAHARPLRPTVEAVVG